MTMLERCRYCGTEGTIEPDLDPAPGVCPPCLDERMAQALYAVAERLPSMQSEAEAKRWLHAELVRIGMTEPWATHFVEGDLTASQAAIAESKRREDARAGSQP